MYKLSLEIGNCTWCHKPKEQDGFKTCGKCRERNRKWAKRWRDKQKEK
jgi:hypothetical protein